MMSPQKYVVDDLEPRAVVGAHIWSRRRKGGDAGRISGCSVVEKCDSAVKQGHGSLTLPHTFTSAPQATYLPTLSLEQHWSSTGATSVNPQPPAGLHASDMPKGRREQRPKGGRPVASGKWHWLDATVLWICGPIERLRTDVPRLPGPCTPMVLCRDICLG
jgi:hypothetical protein